MFKHFPIFDLAVKRSRSVQGRYLNSLGSTQVHTCISRFKVNGPLVQEKKILKAFTTYGQGCHVGHVTWTI